MKKLLALREKGFTLVELMVVVAIIGILSAVAVPNFKKYQAKSKTSEAKLQLSAAYTGEQSFYSDYDTYSYCLRYMGFNPSNERLTRYYAVGMGTDATCLACNTIASSNGAVIGGAGCLAGSGQSVFSAGKTIGSSGTVAGDFASNTYAGATIGTDTFDILAAGVIDIAFTTTATQSLFQIDETKLIKQAQPGY